mgnify:CR=1 FL=1
MTYDVNKDDTAFLEGKAIAADLSKKLVEHVQGPKHNY